MYNHIITFMFAVDRVLELVVNPIYYWLLILIYAIYISAALGVWYVYPGYLNILTNSMQIFVATVLILRFNPFRRTTHILHTFDHNIIFASGIMLLVNAGLAGLLKDEVQQIINVNSNRIPHHTTLPAAR